MAVPVHGQRKPEETQEPDSSGAAQLPLSSRGHDCACPWPPLGLRPQDMTFVCLAKGRSNTTATCDVRGRPESTAGTMGAGHGPPSASSVHDPPVRGLLARFLRVPTESVVCSIGVQPQDLSLFMNPKRERGDRSADEEPATEEQGSLESCTELTSRKPNPPVTCPAEAPGPRGHRLQPPAPRHCHKSSALQTSTSLGLREGGLVALTYNLHRTLGAEGTELLGSHSEPRVAAKLQAVSQPQPTSISTWG